MSLPGILNASEMADSDNNQTPRPAIDWPMELQRHGRWLRSVLVVRSRESGIVEELFQEVALTALRDGHAVRENDKAAPFVVPCRRPAGADASSKNGPRATTFVIARRAFNF